MSRPLIRSIQPPLPRLWVTGEDDIALFEACDSGNLTAVNDALAKGASVNYKKSVSACMLSTIIR